ncbi:MAG: AI-2E family transporter [Roseovarius sp.]|nr:AI-2E family transporter [Roseovarius sp.]
MGTKDEDKLARVLGETESDARVRTTALVIIAFAVVLFLLVQARFLLISLAVAIILFSLTSDVIRLIARQRIGRFAFPNWLASIIALVLISGALLVLSSILLAQLNTVIFTTVSYAERAPEAVASLFSWMGEDVEQAVLNSLSSVQISGYVRTVAGQAGNLMQGTVLVILFVGFLFAERIWFDTKMGNFLGDPAQAERVNKIISSIIHRVNYYLLVKTAVSLITGAMIYVLAQFFGIELALALGILTFILNYIPNIGSIVATGMVALVAYVETGDAQTTGLIFLVSAAIQFLNGNVIDPWMMGRALRLSSFGIIISLAFWGAVWGIPGMFLSVPIMVMLLVICSHVPGLRKVAVLLSREGLPEDEQELDRIGEELANRKAS